MFYAMVYSLFALNVSHPVSRALQAYKYFRHIYSLLNVIRNFVIQKVFCWHSPFLYLCKTKETQVKLITVTY